MNSIAIRYLVNLTERIEITVVVFHRDEGEDDEMRRGNTCVLYFVRICLLKTLLSNQYFREWLRQNCRLSTPTQNSEVRR